MHSPAVAASAKPPADAPPAYQPNAVTFASGAFINGNVDGEADGKSFLLALYIRPSAVGGGVQRYFLGSNQTRISARIAGNGRLTILFQDTAAANALSLTSGNVLAVDTAYTIYASADVAGANQANAALWVNDVDQTDIITFLDATFDYTSNPYGIGALNGGGSPYSGDICDFWFDMNGGFVAASEANRRKFFTADHKLVDKGADGSLPFGSAPTLFYSGATATWHQCKGSSTGPSTLNGSLTTAAVQPQGA